MDKKEWNGTSFINIGQTYLGKDEGNCIQQNNNVNFSSKKTPKNYKSLSDLYEEPNAILFNHSRCNAEKSPKNNNDFYFAEIEPHYEQVYRMIDCTESDKSKCKPITEEEILRDNIHFSKYVPFVEKYYTSFAIDDGPNNNYGLAPPPSKPFKIYGTKMTNNTKDKNNIDPITVDGKFIHWGPYSMEHEYIYKNDNSDRLKINYDTWNCKKYDNEGKCIDKNNVYVDPRYQGLDQNKLYYKNKIGDVTDNELKNVNSLIIPPHIILDMYEKPTYNMDYSQDIPNKNNKTFNPNEFCEHNTNAKKDGWSPGMIRIVSEGPKKDKNSINNSELFNKNVKLYQMVNGINYDFANCNEQKFGDDQNNKTYIEANGISFVDKLNGQYNNKEGITEILNKPYTLNDHMYQPKNPKSLMSIRKMPWSAFLLGCATRQFDSDNIDAICKNYAGQTPNKSSGETDSDKFMKDYCLMKTNNQIHSYVSGSELKKITENNEWKYDKDNKICACIRSGNNTTPYCEIPACLVGGQYVPDNRRQNGCNSEIIVCLTENNINIGGTDGNQITDIRDIKAVNICGNQAGKIDNQICSLNSDCDDDSICQFGNCAKKSCSTNADCKSGNCESGKCAEPKCKTDDECVSKKCNKNTGKCIIDDSTSSDDLDEKTAKIILFILIIMLILIVVGVLGTIIISKNKKQSNNNFEL